jgi:helix-turn-helix protein
VGYDLTAVQLATQLFAFDIRESDSVYVEKIWRTKSVPVERFISVAVPQWELVVTRQPGATWVSIRGPETRASIAETPQDAQFLGIQFRLGTYMPQFPLDRLVDRGVNLPGALDGSFWLDSSTWQLPTFDNADVFVERLVRQGLLVRQIDTVASTRTEQRRALRSTGLTRRAIHQIERAQLAAALIENGASPQEVAWRARYADQAHLTRALKRFVGMTPRQLSLSFKTRSGNAS